MFASAELWVAVAFFIFLGVLFTTAFRASF